MYASVLTPVPRSQTSHIGSGSDFAPLVRMSSRSSDAGTVRSSRDASGGKKEKTSTKAERDRSTDHDDITPKSTPATPTVKIKKKKKIGVLITVLACGVQSI